jgi:hypothetical protein
VASFGDSFVIFNVNSYPYSRYTIAIQVLHQIGIQSDGLLNGKSREIIKAAFTVCCVVTLNAVFQTTIAPVLRNRSLLLVPANKTCKCVHSGIFVVTFIAICSEHGQVSLAEYKGDGRLLLYR